MEKLLRVDDLFIELVANENKIQFLGTLVYFIGPTKPVCLPCCIHAYVNGKLSEK